MTVCLVITRDRVSYTRLCVASLEDAGLDVHLVDHGSTWEPMRDYLTNSPHPVHYRGDQTPRSLWEWEDFRKIVGTQPYLVTDPDVILDCPADWLSSLRRELGEHPELVKVGLGLRVDDLPDTRLAAKVRGWEAPFWVTWLCPWTLKAPVDTTLALYRPGAPFGIVPAGRLAMPYVLRHLPWYSDLDEAETDHYRRSLLPGSSHWANGGW